MLTYTQISLNFTGRGTKAIQATSIPNLYIEAFFKETIRCIANHQVYFKPSGVFQILLWLMPKPTVRLELTSIILYDIQYTPLEEMITPSDQYNKTFHLLNCQQRNMSSVCPYRVHSYSDDDLIPTTMLPHLQPVFLKIQLVHIWKYGEFGNIILPLVFAAKQTQRPPLSNNTLLTMSFQVWLPSSPRWQVPLGHSDTYQIHSVSYS